MCTAESLWLSGALKNPSISSIHEPACFFQCSGTLDFLAQSWAAAAIMLESEETTGAAAMRAALGTDVSGIAQLAHAHCDAQRMYSALYLRTF